MRRQRSVTGGRESLASGVIREVERSVTHLARQHNCSKSFVISTILADTFGIDLGEAYYEQPSSIHPRKTGKRQAKARGSNRGNRRIYAVK